MQNLKRFLLLVILISGSKYTYACDGCGVNLSTMSGSLLNLNNRSFASLYGSSAVFRSTEESGHSISDRFESLNLDFRYAIDDHWSIQSGISQVHKARTENNTDNAISGWGDVVLGLNYALLEELDDNRSLYAEMGLRIALPTSKYNTRLHDIDLPQNFNLGSGSLSYGFTTSVALKKVDSGVILSSNYMYNTAAKNGYTIGNTLILRGAVYKSIALSNTVTGILNTGLQYEHQAKDSFANGKDVLASGSNALYWPVVLGFSIDNLTIQSDIHIPLVQNYINNELNANPRIGLQIIYFLN